MPLSSGAISVGSPLTNRSSGTTRVPGRCHCEYERIQGSKCCAWRGRTGMRLRTAGVLTRTVWVWAGVSEPGLSVFEGLLALRRKQ